MNTSRTRMKLRRFIKEDEERTEKKENGMQERKTEKYLFSLNLFLCSL